MNETLSIRLDPETRKRLDSLSKRSRRSKSSLASEAIAAFVDSEEWRIEEIQKGIQELDSGRGIPHHRVSSWLKSWGSKAAETKAPS
jgi:RHH-type transcriptional regulator, rel operon repressor / antitoxin RelB